MSGLEKLTVCFMLFLMRCYLVSGVGHELLAIAVQTAAGAAGECVCRDVCKVAMNVSPEVTSESGLEKLTVFFVFITMRCCLVSGDGHELHTLENSVGAGAAG